MQISKFFRFRSLLFCLTVAAALTPPTFAQAEEQPVTGKAKQVWQLLDYIAVDYAGAVSKGVVVEPSEYAEMQEFAATAEQQLKELPSSGASESLQRQAAELRAQVAAKADAVAIATQAHKLAADVLKTYPFPVAPSTAPDLAKGARIFQGQCIACHGTLGHGDGPLAASLDPKPTALSEPGRARERSLFALYQVITNGVNGTAMASFGNLSEEDRWALAFFAGTLSYREEDKDAGAKIWQSNTSARQTVPALDALTQSSEQALAERLDPKAAKELTAYLRSTPQALTSGKASGTSLAKTRLAESLAALRAGDRAAANKLALSAYLDGFEPVEPALATRDRSLFEKIESGMAAYRSLIGKASMEDVQAAEQDLQHLLDQAEKTLQPSADDATTAFLGSLTILLREGLEALLVVVAMIAFLKKADRKDVLPYVHAGWVTALAAGGVTWAAATYLVDISGASRELTEGFSSLFAAIVLLGVGMWMHNKSVAGRWQTYLKEKMAAALDKRTAWFLFSLAFISVYREVFETILFYAALWTEGNELPLLAGLATGVVLLSIVAVVFVRTSTKLPIGKFFAASSLLVAILAIVLVGKGIAGLQEAGLLPVSPLAFPRIDILGIYPSWQPLLGQLVILSIAILAFLMNVRTRSRVAPR